MNPVPVSRRAFLSGAAAVTAAYVAGSVRVTPRLTILGGVRGEQTENFVRGAIRIRGAGAVRDTVPAPAAAGHELPARPDHHRPHGKPAGHRRDHGGRPRRP